MEAMASSMSLILSKNVGMTELLKKNSNDIIDTSKEELLKTIKNLIDNRDTIKQNGKINRNILMNSLSNTKNSSKHLLDIFKKI